MRRFAVIDPNPSRRGPGSCRASGRAAFWAGVAVSSALLTLAACSKRTADAPIEQVWAQRCATCHGAAGKGDGEAAVRLDPRPRDLTDPAWQKARDDASIGRTILEGGAAIGRSSLMPPHPDLAPRKAELVAWVRSLSGASLRPEPPTAAR